MNRALLPETGVSRRPVRPYHVYEDDLNGSSGRHNSQSNERRDTTEKHGFPTQPRLPKLEISDHSTSSKPDNFRVSPSTPIHRWDNVNLLGDGSTTTLQPRTASGNTFEESPEVKAANIPRLSLEKPSLNAIDWSGRGTHVDFLSHEEVPLVQGRFLGHGAMGHVYETVVKGRAFAWKRRFCRRGIGEAERKEIDILKKVSHHHIVQLAGSYTHRQFLGLLLYPVATCDLATYLEELDALLMAKKQNSPRADIAVTLDCENVPSGLRCHDGLLPRMGCIISAVDYLHGQSIRHKDLKPSNILLSADNTWLTDFGTATDFSDKTVSTSQDGERGTPKYFAPEMAAYEPVGRPADIFSLGCILWEMHAIHQGQGLEALRKLRQNHDRSFQANLGPIYDFLSKPTEWDVLCDHQIKDQVRKMLLLDPTKRPTITELKETFALLDTFQDRSGGVPLFTECCRALFVSKKEHEQEMLIAKLDTTACVEGEMREKIDDMRKERDEAKKERDDARKKIEEAKNAIDEVRKEIEEGRQHERPRFPPSPRQIRRILERQKERQGWEEAQGRRPEHEVSAIEHGGKPVNIPGVERSNSIARRILTEVESGRIRKSHI